MHHTEKFLIVCGLVALVICFLVVMGLSAMTERRAAESAAYLAVQADAWIATSRSGCCITAEPVPKDSLLFQSKLGFEKGPCTVSLNESRVETGEYRSGRSSQITRETVRIWAVTCKVPISRRDAEDMVPRRDAEDMVPKI
jgi:hypothetical protein